MASEKIIAALDIGTSWTRTVIGSINRDDELVIESVAERPSEGVKNGSIVNMEQTVKVISQVMNECEVQAGSEASSVILSIGGDHIQGIESNGVVGINNKDLEIRNEDIRRSIDVAKNRLLPQNKEIIHTLVQDFQVDSRTGIRDPIDMLGHRLDTHVLLAVGSSPVIQNQKKCVQKSGLQVQKLVLSSLADAEVVLSQEEKDQGAILINIGSGSTDWICYQNGAPISVGGIPIGGEAVTSDISYLMQLPKVVAESVKITDGSAFSPNIDKAEMILTPSVGGRPPIRLPRIELSKVIEARMAEIFSMIQQRFEEQGISRGFGAGVFLVGGGSLLSGATELAAEIFHLPARMGFPEAIGGLDRVFIDPRYSTLIGLLKVEARKNSRDNPSFSQKKDKKRFGGKLKGFLGKLF